MTSQENATLAKLVDDVSDLKIGAAKTDAKVDGMGDDIGEIKVGVAQLVAAQQTTSTRANDRHARIDSRIAVLESTVARLEKALWATGSIGGGALLGHVPAAIQALGG